MGQAFLPCGGGGAGLLNLPATLCYSNTITGSINSLSTTVDKIGTYLVCASAGKATTSSGLKGVVNTSLAYYIIQDGVVVDERVESENKLSISVTEGADDITIKVSTSFSTTDDRELSMICTKLLD